MQTLLSIGSFDAFSNRRHDGPILVRRGASARVAREQRQAPEGRAVSILLTQIEQSIAAVVEGHGRGFDHDATGNDVLRHVGMRERVALVRDRLRIESSEGAGTMIAAEVPAP